MRRASSRRVHEHKRRSSLTELLSEKSGQFRSVRSYSVFVLKQLFWYCGLRSVLPIHVVPLHERARIPPVARISGRGTSFPSKRKFAYYMWEGGYITATRPQVTHTSAARPSRRISEVDQFGSRPRQKPRRHSEPNTMDEKSRLVAEQGATPAPSPAERWKPTRAQSVGLFTACAALMSMQPLLQNLSKDGEVRSAPSKSRVHLVHAACAAVAPRPPASLPAPCTAHMPSFRLGRATSSIARSLPSWSSRSSR